MERDKQKEPIFKNVSGIEQVVYELGDTHNPTTIPPGGTVKGERFESIAGPGKPFERVE